MLYTFVNCIWLADRSNELDRLFLTWRSLSSFCILSPNSLSSRQRFLSSEVSSWTQVWDWTNKDSWACSLTHSRKTGYEEDLNSRNESDWSGGRPHVLTFLQSLTASVILGSNKEWGEILTLPNKDTINTVIWTDNTRAHAPFLPFRLVALWVSTAWQRHPTPRWKWEDIIYSSHAINTSWIYFKEADGLIWPNKET